MSDIISKFQLKTTIKKKVFITFSFYSLYFGSLCTIYSIYSGKPPRGLSIYLYFSDHHLRRKERSPSTSGYGSFRSGNGTSLVDYQERSTDDEMQSSVNSVTSIASSIASFASHLGFTGSFSGQNRAPSTTPDPPFSSSIPSDTSVIERSPGLKRVSSSPSKLAAHGVRTPKNSKFGIGFIFNTAHPAELSFEQLKSFVFKNIHIIETQVMECKKLLFEHLDSGDTIDYERIITDMSECFLHYLNMVVSVKRIGNLWQTVNFGGLVGSRRAKNNAADLICDLYNQYESERKFMSTAITAILSATSTWHSSMCDPHFPYVSTASRKFLDWYGGPGSNFPVRIAFISHDNTLLQGFLALTSYFQRSAVYVKNTSHKKVKFVTANTSQISDFSFSGFGEKISTAVPSALETGTFTFLVEENTDNNKSASCPRYSTSFVDYPLSRKLSDDNLITPNENGLPVITSTYHPSFPVMGLETIDGIFRDFKCGFSAFHEALKLNINGEVVSKMVVNDANNFDCKVWVHDGTYQSKCKINSSTAVARILKNFVDLKELTGNSKLCLIYLESELQSLAYIREAYLTFCQNEPSPPQRFLDIFNMDKSDGEFFSLIKK